MANHTELILMFMDHSGHKRRMVTNSDLITLGRDAANDVAIDDSNLSRRHAVIERNRESFQVRDCNSRNGTTVNGHPVVGSVELVDGDIINLGANCDITVHLNQPSSAQDPARFSAPVIAGAAIVLIMIGAGVLLAFHKLTEPLKSSANANITAESPKKVREVVQRTPSTTNVDATPQNTPENSEQVQTLVKRVMSKLSNDNASYISEAGVKDVRERIEKYRGSAELKERLRAAKLSCPEITSEARSIRLRPALLMYAALAETDVQTGGVPIAAARRMVPRLLTLRATFGTETANSSLLLIAAYPYPFNPPIGSQTRTPHPLASKLVELGGRRSTVDTSEARSVWFLREKNGITDEAYDLVIRLLAIGVIAQNPNQYGIEAEPPLC